MSEHDTVRAIEWTNRGLRLLDQRRLPQAVEYLQLQSIDAVIEAIAEMVVRGAPAIGITAAYGAALAARAHDLGTVTGRAHFEEDLTRLCDARPTAVNLRWAVERMRQVVARVDDAHAAARLLEEAQRVHAQDIADNRRMGELGAAFLAERCAVMTHCNAGALATGGYGTALGVIRSAYTAGRIEQVYAPETRPWLQGARLTAWELARDGVPVTVITDSAGATVMRQGRVQWLIVGADRVAANGDVANKIGTYTAAVCAQYHEVRVMVVAPSSTVDMETPDGEHIPIENRDAREIFAGPPPAGVKGLNPVFDITPASLIDVLVTERGAIENPNREKMAALMGA